MPVRARKLAAPIGGWNTRDAVSLMSPRDALSMTNLIPGIDGVTLRPGFTQYVELISGVASLVRTLINWKTQYGERLIAASHSGSDHRLFDITTSTVSTIKSGYFASQWRHAVMSGALGLVNGADQPQRLTFTPGSGVQVRDMPISGGVPNPQALKVVFVHKSRSYFASGDEPAFWYSAVNALGGTLSRFPIDRVAETSGNVIDIRAWTRDGGSGPDDFAVFFLDTGEVLVYRGSNPGDATDWSLVGRYRLGRVLTTIGFAGKIHVVTEADYNVFPDDLLTEGLTRPTKLSGAARDAVSKDQSANWQIFIDPALGWQIVNVPAGSKREQHVLNLRTGGPTRFDIDAQVWARFKGDLYFGGRNAKVYRMREGDDDGTAIEFSAQQAFTDFGLPQDKGVRNYRPVFTTQGALSYSSGLAYDYNSRDFAQSLTTQSTGPPWDTSPWDTTSWGKGNPAKTEWLSGAGMGQNISLFINGTATKKTTWHSTDFRLEIANDVL